MRKGISSKEEYFDLIDRLKFIDRERELLEKLSNTNNYNAHIKLPNSFGELLINIIRENNHINESINIIIQGMLINYKNNKDEFKKINDNITKFVDYLRNYNKNVFPKDIEPVIILNDYPAFTKAMYEIYELIKRKQANSYLYSYVISLENEQQELLKRKNKYEKQTKKVKKYKESLELDNSIVEDEAIAYQRSLFETYRNKTKEPQIENYKKDFDF